MELWTGLILGLVTSLHCVGMCGPIAIALPAGFPSKSRLIASRLLYNAGRTLTYTALGIASGIIGQTIAMAGLQRGLSIATGVIILLAVLLPTRLIHRVMPTQTIAKSTARIKQVWGRMFRSDSLYALFLIGLLNGLLPCGPLYVALAAAAATGSVFGSAGFMFFFGLGTTPSLLATSLFGPVLGVSIRQRLAKLLPVGAVVLGLLLVLRGMSLGIPYISPNMDRTPEMIQQGQHPCCH
jgi:sulfite exporter TauE/SafE